jgi:hypothetical protein
VAAIAEGGAVGTRVALGAGVAVTTGVGGAVGWGVGAGPRSVTTTGCSKGSGSGLGPVAVVASKTTGQLPGGSSAVPRKRPFSALPLPGTRDSGTVRFATSASTLRAAFGGELLYVTEKTNVVAVVPLVGDTFPLLRAGLAARMGPGTTSEAVRANAPSTTATRSPAGSEGPGETPRRTNGGLGDVCARIARSIPHSAVRR